MSEQTEHRRANIMSEWAPLLRRLSGVDDVVTGVCPDCQFEQGRVGYDHSPACSRRESVEKEVMK